VSSAEPERDLYYQRLSILSQLNEWYREAVGATVGATDL